MTEAEQEWAQIFWLKHLKSALNSKAARRFWSHQVGQNFPKCPLIICSLLFLTLFYDLDHRPRSTDAQSSHQSWTHQKLGWNDEIIPENNYLWSPMSSTRNILLFLQLVLKLKSSMNCLPSKTNLSLFYILSLNEDDAATSSTGAVFIKFGGISQLKVVDIPRRNYNC